MLDSTASRENTRPRPSSADAPLDRKVHMEQTETEIDSVTVERSDSESALLSALPPKIQPGARQGPKQRSVSCSGELYERLQNSANVRGITICSIVEEALVGDLELPDPVPTPPVYSIEIPEELWIDLGAMVARGARSRALALDRAINLMIDDLGRYPPCGKCLEREYCECP